MKMRVLSIKLILILHLLIAGISAQIAPGKYWIQFSDKSSSPYSINNPDEFLSDRAINRRSKYQIDLNENDLPVNPQYVDSLRKIGFTIINISRWLNGAVVATSDTSLISTALKLSFVKEIPFYSSENLNISFPKDKFKLEQNKDAVPLYGASANQIEMLHGDYLHQNGFNGQDMLIAVLDAGFDNADIISSLRHIWDSNHVLAYFDFVKDGIPFFETFQHGTVVLSAIAGIEENTLYGTAPLAYYTLIRTEADYSEYLIEEYNWVCGAEFADSIGADVINSSLSYSQFDDPQQNHTYNDMDGKTNISSIGATIASSKGIIVVNSAGNAGDSPWYRIGSPGDADGILTIGAVDPFGIITEFSSRGPSYDKRVKPDVCAQGRKTIAQDKSGAFIEIGGTSLSSPLIAGMAACLWQSNRNANNLQIMDAIRMSSSQYSNPDSAYGYGIPDFSRADRILKNQLLPEYPSPLSFFVFPNPVADVLNVEIYPDDNNDYKPVLISIYDVSGRLVMVKEYSPTYGNIFLQLAVGNLTTGVYRMIIDIGGKICSSEIIKIR